MGFNIDLLENDKNIEKNVDLKESQNIFLNSTIGKVINTGIDIGLKAVLPDFLENQVIEIKDVLINNGLESGIKEVVNQGINMGKSAAGIFTGEFENISQIENVVKKGGLIDSTSKVLDMAINLAEKNDVIDRNVAKLIKQGKNSILSTVESKIEETLTEQIKTVEKLDEYCEKWQSAYKNQDLNNMQKAFKNLENYKEKIVPLKNIISKAEKIENIHTYIMNNNGSFNISETEKELLNKLA